MMPQQDPSMMGGDPSMMGGQDPNQDPYAAPGPEDEQDQQQPFQ